MCHMLCLDEHLYMENEKRKTGEIPNEESSKTKKSSLSKHKKVADDH